MDLYTQMMREEGIRFLPYLDEFGNGTIGIGHKILPGENFSPFVNLTKGQVDFIYNQDMQTVLDELSTLPWFNAADPIRQAAFLNMGFNMGETRLLGFKCMEADALVGNWQGVHDQALASVWAKELKYDPANPLKSRPGRVAQQLLTGEWV